MLSVWRGCIVDRRRSALRAPQSGRRLRTSRRRRHAQGVATPTAGHSAFALDGVHRRCDLNDTPLCHGTTVDDIETDSRRRIRRESRRRFLQISIVTRAAGVFVDVITELELVALEFAGFRAFGRNGVCGRTIGVRPGIRHHRSRRQQQDNRRNRRRRGSRSALDSAILLLRRNGAPRQSGRRWRPVAERHIGGFRRSRRSAGIRRLRFVSITFLASLPFRCHSIFAASAIGMTRQRGGSSRRIRPTGAKQRQQR